MLSSLVTGFTQDATTVPAPHPLMHFSAEEKQQLMLDHLRAPQVSVEKNFTKDFATSLSLLSRLPYVPAERDQGNCGDCWQWAGTGVMEIAHDVQNGVHDRLSVQFINSCNTAKSCCLGGWLRDLAAFYSSMGYAIPWANNNAQFLSSGGDCSSAPCGSIATTPRYSISQISAVSITTWGVGQAQAIANIKSVLNQNKAVWFGFFMGNESDWAQFDSFWNNQPESAVRTNFFCGQVYDPNNGGGGHAVLCVGYNDDNPANRYWIMVNSWGTTAGRPNGIFRVSMDLNYDCAESPLGYNLYWQTLDIQFASTPPANDQCSGAVTVSSSGYTNTQSTASATSTGDPAPGCVSGFGNGVWYKYTPASSGRIVVDTMGSDFDTGLAIYTGTCGSLTQVACDDDNGGNRTSLITSSVTAGTTYCILAGGHNGLTGNLVFHLAFTSTVAPSATIWAVSATASSQYSSTSWSAAQATGAPDTTACGDIITAWAPSSSGTAPEWLQVSFGTPRQAVGVQIHETHNAPFIYQVDLIDSGGINHTVWSGVDSTTCPGWFVVNFPVTSYLVTGAKIYTQVAGWEEIDAAGLSLPTIQTNWAVSATASSQYSSTSWSAAQATGAPDTTACGDIITAWAPSSSGTAPEWLQVSFGTPRQAVGVQIHETHNAPFIYQVDLIDSGGINHTVWSGVDSTTCPGWFVVNVPATSYLVTGARIYTQVAGWEEIDAVGLLTSVGGTAPSITAQPQSRTNVVGTTATFGVTASGTSPLSYQWRADGINISGATSPTYTNGSVQLSGSGRQLSCLVSNAFGIVLSSNALLTVVAAGVNNFTWSPIASPQTTNTAISVTISARDPNGATVSSFAGAVALSASAGGSVPSGAIFGNVGYFWSGNNGYCTIGYAFTPNTALHVTHVRHLSGSKVSIWTDGGILLASQDVSSVQGNWTETPLATPLVLAAGRRYRVGVYTAGQTYYRGGAGVAAFNDGTIDQSCEASGDHFPDWQENYNWWLVDLRYTVATHVSITPSVSGNFVNGVWTGNIQVLQTASNAVLQTDDGAGHNGSSNPFQVATLTVVPVPVRFLPGSLARTNGQFGFTLQGQVGGRFEIQASTNLVNWTNLATLTNVTGTIPFLDPATNFNRRFYRAHQLP